MNRPPLIYLFPLVLLVMTSTSCTTIANRRDLYFPQTVWGPYTRIRHEGLPKTTTYRVVETTRSSSSSDGKKVIKPLQ